MSGRGLGLLKCLDGGGEAMGGVYLKGVCLDLMEEMGCGSQKKACHFWRSADGS